MTDKCPSCGSSVLYQGLKSIECAGPVSCPNARKKQPIRKAFKPPSGEFARDKLPSCSVCFARFGTCGCE